MLLNIFSPFEKSSVARKWVIVQISRIQVFSKSLSASVKHVTRWEVQSPDRHGAVPRVVRGDRNKLLCCCSSAELSPFPLSQASRADISAALADKLTIKYKKKENGRCSVTWRRYQNKLIKICSSLNTKCDSWKVIAVPYPHKNFQKWMNNSYGNHARRHTKDRCSDAKKKQIHQRISEAGQQIFFM